MATQLPARSSRSTAKFIMMGTKPAFSSPSRLAAGTRQPSKESSAVSEAHQPILSSFLLTVKPGVPRSITSSEMPPWPGPPVRTAVTTKSARQPEVMNILLPVTT